MAEKEKGEISMQQLWQRHGISDDSDSGAASSSDSNSEPASPISTKVPLYSKSEVESLFREGREYASAKLQELDSLYEQAGFDADGNSGFQTPEAVSYFDRAVNSDGQDAAPNAGEGFISHSSALRRTYWPVKPVSSYRRR
jgi:hypothetical protein